MGEIADRPRAWLDSADSGDGRLVVRIGGELDLDSVTGIEDGVDALLARHGGQPATVDLGELVFLDSSGVAVLIRLANCLGPMRITHAHPAVRRVIEVLGLSTRLGLDRD